jgi:hypothetical protein
MRFAVEISPWNEGILRPDETDGELVQTRYLEALCAEISTVGDIVNPKSPE